MIFYLSCTGNTRWAATYLSQALHEPLVNVAEVRLKDVHEWQLTRDETVGFCFPVHGWRPPRLLREWIARQRFVCPPEGQPYTFALCTVGDTTGEALDVFGHDLRQSGLKVHAAFSVCLPNTYVGLPFMDVDATARAQAKWHAAQGEMSQAVCSIANRAEGNYDAHAGRWRRINTRVLGKYFTEHLLTDSPFRVDAQQCTKCGLCAKVCPVGNIRQAENDVPHWLHQGDCLTCFACYHACPQKAIAYGARTKGKGQYRAASFRLAAEKEVKETEK